MKHNQQMLKQRAADAARIERETELRSERVAVLQSLDCLHHVPPEELERLVDLCTFRAFLAYQTIIHEHNHDQVKHLYLLLQGSVSLNLHDRDGREVLLGVLERGDCFGEGGLFGDFFRHVGAYAETHCQIMQLPLSSMRTLLQSAPQLHQALQRIYLHRLAEFTLARVPVFSHLTPVERMALVNLLQPRHYERERVIVRQGEPGSAMYLIQSGQVVVEQDGQAIASMREGDFFGEMALLTNQSRNATVETLSPVDVLVLPTDDFRRLLQQQPALEDRLHAVMHQRQAMDTHLQQTQMLTRRIPLALQHGLLRGSHLLVFDPQQCAPNCRACEQACIHRHGHLRLHLEGVEVGNRVVVDTCRQCQVGAECAEVCPEHAFEWNAKGALFITDACTGCGECVPACPYDAVIRVPRERAPVKGMLMRVSGAVNQLRQLSVIPLEPYSYTHRADKCDLCHGYADLACVVACPHGALQLVPVEELLPL